MIPPSETIADVGSDHGKLSAFCLLKGRCRRIIATDIHKLPAQRTRETLESLGLMEKSEVLVADGLTGVPLSVDTFKSETAKAAITAGCDIINDITGFMGDPEMAQVVADNGVGAILMFNKRTNGENPIAFEPVSRR